MMREARAMGKISDVPRVVRYYDAWIEYLAPEMSAIFVDHDVTQRSDGKWLKPTHILFLQL